MQFSLDKKERQYLLSDHKERESILYSLLWTQNFTEPVLSIHDRVTIMFHYFATSLLHKVLRHFSEINHAFPIKYDQEKKLLS